MDVLVHRDVIEHDLTTCAWDPENIDFLQRARSRQELNIWLTAETLQAVARQALETCGKNKAQILIDRILSQVSIIPLRASAISRSIAAAGGDFEIAANVSAARTLGIKHIVTLKKGADNSDGIRVFSPATFWEYLNAGYPSDVVHVPFLDLKAQMHQVYNDIDERLGDIIGNTAFILGRHVEEFEKRFAEFQQVKYCIGVSSGTDALHIALQVLGIGIGDKVIVPVNTFIATAEAVTLCGAEPVFVDCDAWANIDTGMCRHLLKETREKGLTMPKAIVPVHLYGQPADMTALGSLADEYDLLIVEDACQAHLAQWDGVPVGNFGQFTAFSFYPGKNLGAWGEAGALVTNDRELFESARRLRQHGEVQRYHHQVVGHNYRMEAFQGAVLAAKLDHLYNWTQQRRQNARMYNQLLADIEQVQTPAIRPEATSVYHLYVIQAEQRDKLQTYLADKGIATGLHYPRPLHLQPAYGHLGYRQGDFPAAESFAAEMLSLPMFPELSIRQIEYVCDHIAGFYNAYQK